MRSLAIVTRYLACMLLIECVSQAKTSAGVRVDPWAKGADLEVLWVAIASWDFFEQGRARYSQNLKFPGLFFGRCPCRRPRVLGDRKMRKSGRTWGFLSLLLCPLVSSFGRS